MTLQIDQGLFRLEMIDHHAILGIPLNSDAKQVRKPYLKIVRRLHPDSHAAEGEGAKQKASELLSKLVNPAYEMLSNEKEVAEYSVLLKLKGQQLQRQGDTVQLATDAARKLASAANVDHVYQTELKALSAAQYESLDRALEITGQISELNLVYLMRTAGGKMEVKAGQPESTPSATTAASAKTAKTEKGKAYKPQAGQPPEPIRSVSLLEQYIRRAEDFELRKDYTSAVRELREALQTNPRSADCHARLGQVYLKSKQGTMAKIHFGKALEYDPQNQLALEGKKLLEQASKKQSQATAQKSSAQEKSKGGLFGLFGGKKK